MKLTIPTRLALVGMWAILCFSVAVAEAGSSPRAGEPHQSPSPAEDIRVEFRPVMINDGDGVRNGGFEQWMDGNPMFWTFPQDHAPYHVRSEGDPKEGRYVLKMIGGYGYTKLRCHVHIFGAIEGKKVVLSAWVKSTDDKSAYMSITPEGQEAKYAKHHPADGKWHRIEAAYQVPEESPPHSFVVDLNHRQYPKAPCYYDSITVEVRD